MANDQISLIHPSVRIWPGTVIREGVKIAEGTTIGRNVYIGPGVEIGKNCKIQNNVNIYEPAVISDGVFIGPGAILTNDKLPRAINSDESIKGPDDWSKSRVEISYGASIGAGAICVAPVKIGMWAMIGAGAIVISDVIDHSLVVGVPGKQVGWVGKLGTKLTLISNGLWECPVSKDVYNLGGSIE